VKDNYGNEWSGSIEVTSFDIVWPTKPILKNLSWTVVYDTSVDINWYPSIATWCADLSGYIIKVCERGTSSCQQWVISAPTTEWTATSLNNNTVYDVTLWAEDTLWNPSPMDTWWFYVDTGWLHCYITPDRNQCGTGPVKLILTWDWDMLGWSSVDNLMTIDRLELTVSNLNKVSFVWYVKDSSTWRTWSCVYDIREVLDQNAPTIQSAQFVWEQCSVITWDIQAHDVWCAWLTWMMYKFPDSDWSINNKYALSQNDVWEKIVVVEVKDSLENQTSWSVKYVWTDTKPVASSFTMSLLAWNTISWKTASKANEWACGSDRLTATVQTNGSRWTCTISGSTLIYKLTNGDAWITDRCTLRIKDAEDNTVDVVVTITDINKMPSVRLLSPANGSIFLYWSSVDLRWTVDDAEYVDISGFNYSLTNKTETISWFTANTWLSGLKLQSANYTWDVSIVLANDDAEIKSKPYKFYIVQWSGVAKDFCPNW
jgi:hypothetical protein